MRGAVGVSVAAANASKPTRATASSPLGTDHPAGAKSAPDHATRAVGAWILGIGKR
jgi:hypothetical protein